MGHQMPVGIMEVQPGQVVGTVTPPLPQVRVVGMSRYQCAQQVQSLLPDGLRLLKPPLGFEGPPQAVVMVRQGDCLFMAAAAPIPLCRHNPPELPWFQAGEPAGKRHVDNIRETVHQAVDHVQTQQRCGELRPAATRGFAHSRAGNRRTNRITGKIMAR